MNAILDIARKHNLLVIEDAAQALLSKYKGKHLGTIGHLGCLSFHETKNIISGEGGALLVNDEHLTERAEVIREKGTNRNKFFRGLVDKYTWVDIGSSYLPSELIGAFLYAQLEQSEKIIETRRALFQRYYSSLRPLEDKSCLRLPYVQNDCACNGHIFYVITHSYKERAALLQYLNKNDVNAVFHYIPLHSSPAGMKYGKTRGNMKITDEMSGKILRLPMYYEMNAADVDTVVNLIYTFYGQTG
jgi:dTDP-4-amino-4,6-dideoxygalactose transaminase